MILRNFYNYLQALVMDGIFEYTTYNGSKSTKDFRSSRPSYSKGLQLAMAMGTVETKQYGTWGSVCFGDGDTAPTIDDYCLSGTVITGISATSNVVASTEGDTNVLTATYTITNNNSTDITIKEIMLNTGYYLTSASSSYTGSIATDRTVLDEPVTIEAGGVGVVTYTIRFDPPVAA